jgi:hypothetical protein
MIVADRDVAWPFLLAASRTSAYRLIVAPDFMLARRAALGALRASPEHLAGAASRVALREVDSSDGRFCILYRVTGDRMRDFGFGGDEAVTDQNGRRIDVFEGLVFRRDRAEGTWPAIGCADLNRAHDLVRDHYRGFWTQDGHVRTTGSACFPVTGRGGTVRPTVLPPWHEEEPLPRPGGQIPMIAAACQQPARPEEPPADEGTEDDRTPPRAVADPRRTPPRRTRGLIIAVAAVVACAAAGGFAWAQSKAPPVLRPAGLRVGSSGETSIELDWAGPATGPAPERYLIVLTLGLGGKKEFLIPGTRTSYPVTGLTPATSYSVRLTAIRGGVSSPESAALAASTVTPQPSQGLLAGRWLVRYALTFTSFDRGIFTQSPTSRASWDIAPTCESGACQELTLSGTVGGGAQAIKFRLPLHRSDGSYLGTGRDLSEVCVGDSKRPIRALDTLNVEIHATRAGPDAGVWTVTAWRGSLEVDIPAVHYKPKDENKPVASCPGGTITFSVAS